MRDSGRSRPAKQASQYTATTLAVHPKFLHSDQMNITRLFSLLVLALLASCTEQSPPQFGDPVPVIVPAGTPAYGPRLTQRSSDDAILSWMERNDDNASLRYATYYDGEWQAPMMAASDERMFVNWADLPAVVATGSGTLLAHWLSNVADAPYAYQVLTSISYDGGASWSVPESPHSDGTPTEHGFVSTYAADDGTGLMWLDGRNTPDNGMTLRSAIMSSDGELRDEVLVDDLVCDCCQTDVAMTKDGPIAIYRNRTSEEVRDIYMSRFANGSWQPGTPVSDDGWIISGCPVSGPSIAATDKQVAIAWFTAANGKPMVKTVFSTDAGKSFSKPVIVAAEGALGGVDVALIDRQSYVVTWMEKTQGKPYAIQLRAITTKGQIGAIETVGRTNVASTVPQLARVADKLLISWTDDAMGESKVASVKVPILEFYD